MLHYMYHYIKKHLVSLTMVENRAKYLHIGMLQKFKILTYQKIDTGTRKFSSSLSFFSRYFIKALLQ